jgi:hypothetical protein
MHNLKHETKAIKAWIKDWTHNSSEDGIFSGRPSRKRRIITEPPCHLNRVQSISLYPNSAFPIFF